ncbi:hypothetical protein MPTK1_6g02500 [Marchantia polymorpha subsp. ruderalis]|uniref:Sugar phosphate transporter domain-containing protein n=2 Tax=Marchantia polymorpha TaxID=3197 RepID=A0AAF6BMS4_MARPO|nr:hypothetical protein MARPO_0035s0035 [Marchantia polymorpha]BBN13308.1 hypothetical protein Mp_6g02500 [Marchantia polymorpha subsp. ruderalis]|eukprot:PTQ41236.1 hypothetical protein MARPO_0035s0035 [Marchantia polymorpha]
MSNTTNGVKVFTVVVLSGSLFFLIYHIGRRRLQQIPKPDSPRETPLNPRPAKGPGGHHQRYFSHHYEKSYPRISSISEAVVSSQPSARSSRGHTGTNNRYGTDEVHDDASTASEHSDADTPSSNPYVLSSTDAALRNNLENRGKKLRFELGSGAEQSFLDHLSNSSTFGHQQAPSNDTRHISPGDLSSFEQTVNDHKQETRQKGVAGCSTTIDRVPRDAAEHSSFLGIVPLERTVPHKKALISSSISPTTSFFKALLYSFMWCILSHSFLLFSTTGMGVTMATFPAPFLRITVHFIIQTILASCMLRWPMKRIISMSWTTFLWRVFPVAVAATVDHEPQATPFSNVCENLKVPVANILACKCEGPFNDMRNIFREKALLAVCRVQSKCKACVPLIVVVLTTIFKLDEHSHSAFCNIVTISVGFMIAVYKEEEVENWSLTESSLGSAISAFRLAATQNLLQNREIGLVSPVVTMRALAPAMALVTAVSSYFVDPWRTLHMTEFFNTTEHTLKTWAHIVVGAFLETSVALSELVVIYHSSANAMIIVVMFKEVALLTIPEGCEEAQISGGIPPTGTFRRRE